ncbi:MAG: hypothetical protein IKE70_00605 [Bacilli bacterium]|nr:hypothetical protein [Bacilli bacterium]
MSKFYDIEKDHWIYIFLLSSILILMESLQSYSFKAFGVSLSFRLFLFPFVYLTLSYLLKKIKIKKCFFAVFISSLSLIFFHFITSYIIQSQIDFKYIIGEIIGYCFSEIIFLMIYHFLIHNNKSDLFIIYLNYLFSFVIYYLFYTLIFLNFILLEDFWITYFFTIILQAIVCIPITIFDSSIKRGI